MVLMLCCPSKMAVVAQQSLAHLIPSAHLSYKNQWGRTGLTPLFRCSDDRRLPLSSLGGPLIVFAR